MKKELSKMTLEELWKLFPIFLVKPNPEKWNVDYITMVNNLKQIIDFNMVNNIYHIGSTAINGIWAKDIVDILIEMKEKIFISIVAETLTKNGFSLMSKSKDRISMKYGYTKDGFAEHVFHIHIRKLGDIDEVFFKNYLNAHFDIAKEYETLKISLWKKYEHNRDAYTDSKGEFIKKWTLVAKSEK